MPVPVSGRTGKMSGPLPERQAIKITVMKDGGRWWSQAESNRRPLECHKEHLS